MVRNFFHLSLLRGINVISPLILFPYLIRTIGMSNWGHLTVAFSVTTYLSLIGDYGFHQSAIRETAQNRNNRDILSNMYWTITLIRPLLVLITALVLFTLVGLSTGKWWLTMVWFSGIFIAIGECIQPVWFFQGIEKMQNLVYSNLISRLAGLFFVLFFVRTEADYYYTLPLLGLGTIGGALVSHFILMPSFQLIYPLQDSKLEFRHQLRMGYPFFIRSIALSLYANLPVFFLNYTAPAHIVGHFGVADRIVAMSKAVLSAFSHAIYPQLFKHKSEGHGVLVAHFKKYFNPYILVISIGSLVLFVFAAPIIRLYSGEDIPEAVPILRAMAFLPVSLALAQPMSAFMQVYGRERLESRILLGAGGFNFLLNLFLIPHELAFGAALSLFITETFIVLLFLWFFERKYRSEAYFLKD